MDEKRFPILGGLTISWPAAERAYKEYVRQCGSDQSLERLAERGGFGVFEFVYFYSGIDIVGGRRPSENRIAQTLADGDVRRA